jgi:DNA repair ATPase RecN
VKYQNVSQIPTITGKAMVNQSLTTEQYCKEVKQYCHECKDICKDLNIQIKYLEENFEKQANILYNISHCYNSLAKRSKVVDPSSDKLFEQVAQMMKGWAETIIKIGVIFRGSNEECFKMRAYQMETIEELSNRREAISQEYIKACDKLNKQKEKVFKSLSPLENKEDQAKKLLPEVYITVGNCIGKVCKRKAGVLFLLP